MTDSMTMPKVKIAISVGRELFDEIERYSKRNKVSRSEVFSRGVRQLLREQQNDRITSKSDKASREIAPSLESMAWEKLAMASMAELLKSDQW